MRLETRFIIARLCGPNSKHCRRSEEWKRRTGGFVEEVKLELDLQDGWKLSRWRREFIPSMKG